MTEDAMSSESDFARLAFPQAVDEFSESNNVENAQKHTHSELSPRNAFGDFN